MESLSEIAARTRTSFFSSSLVGRNNARAYILKEFRSIKTASVTSTGDLEMMRGSINPLGVQNGAVDAYVRSSYAGLVEVMTLRLAYNPTTQRFSGRLRPLGTVLSIDSVTSAVRPDLQLDDGVSSVRLLTQSSSARRAPLLSGAYSTLEQLWLGVKMPRDNSGNPLVVPGIDKDGNQYADFQVTYRTEAMVPVLQAYLASSDVRSGGIDALVRAYLGFQSQYPVTDRLMRRRMARHRRSRHSSDSSSCL